MRLLSRLTIGDAGTIIASSASTNTGSYDAVSALSAGTATVVVSGATATNVAFAGGSILHGDISQVIYGSGGPFAIYVRKD